MTDPRIIQLAEARYRDGHGATSEEAWDTLDAGLKQFLIGEAEAWLSAAIAAGLIPPTTRPVTARTQRPADIRALQPRVHHTNQELTMNTRTFTRAELDALGVPDTCTAVEGSAAEHLHEEQVDTRRWVSVNELVFRAHDDGITYAVRYEQGLTETQDGTDPWGYADEIEAVAVEERPVVTQQWLPLDAPADPGLDTVLPAWEAMYEPGNVSDYLIGYANSEAAAKGTAEVWLRSESEVIGRLEWLPQNPSDGYDTEFELIERHDDGVDTGPGVTVRRRTRGEAQR